MGHIDGEVPSPDGRRHFHEVGCVVDQVIQEPVEESGWRLGAQGGGVLVAQRSPCWVGRWGVRGAINRVWVWPSSASDGQGVVAPQLLQPGTRDGGEQYLGPEDLELPP